MLSMMPLSVKSINIDDNPNLCMCYMQYFVIISSNSKNIFQFCLLVLSNNKRCMFAAASITDLVWGQNTTCSSLGNNEYE